VIIKIVVKLILFEGRGSHSRIKVYADVMCI